MTPPALPAVVTLAALIAYQGTVMAVGQARVKHKVLPPARSGPEGFERAMRVQQNTLEQLVFFLPTFWLAALLGSEARRGAWLSWAGQDVMPTWHPNELVRDPTKRRPTMEHLQQVGERLAQVPLFGAR